MTGTHRQRAIRKAIGALAPGITLYDAEEVNRRASAMRALPPSIDAWLALTSHVRHRFTDYDALLAEGYDRDAARYFVLDDMDAALAAWGCRRSVRDARDDADEEAADADVLHA